MAANGIEIFQPDAQVGELKLWRPPVEVLREAQQAAVELQRIIQAKAKKVVFNGEQYLEFEDWETLAHFYGYCPKVESTQHVEFGDVQGFKASAVLISERTGLVVSRAESMCLNDEENWGARPKYEWRKTLGPDNKPIFNQDTGKYRGEKVQIGTVPTPLFQLLSMAQTRACAKVCRNKLAWVAVLAGYKPTPAEEMDETVPAVEPEPSLPTELKRKSPQPVPRAAEAPAAPATPAAVAPAPPPTAAPRPEPVSVLPKTPTWCECGHISGQHGGLFPHRCACDGNRWENGVASICNCRSFKAKPLQPASSATPRSEPSRGKVITEGQSRRFYAIRKGSGWSTEQTKDYLRETFGIEDDRLIPASGYEKACAWAQKGPGF